MDLPHIRSAPRLRRSINVRVIFSSKDNSERWSRGLPRRLVFPTLPTASVESGLSAWRWQGLPSVNLSGHRREISGCRSRGRSNKHCGEYCHGTEEHGPQPVRETKRRRSCKTLLRVSQTAQRLTAMVVFAVKYEPVSTRKSQIRADLQGLFTKNGCFCETLPEFWVDVQRLGSKFPKISISDLFLEISELSGGNCELLRKSRPLLKRRFGLIMPHSVSFPTMQLFYR